MAQRTERTPTEKERDHLVQVLSEAHEALRIVPDVDPGGPALIWLADRLLEVERRNGKTGG